MLGGFNTNVPYKGEIYHVQTEDGGTKNPLLITHLYHKGAIMASEKFNYAELLIEEGWRSKVAQAMKDQHKRVIKGLLAGKYTGGEAGDAEKAPPLPMETTGDDGARPLASVVMEFILPTGGTA